MKSESDYEMVLASSLRVGDKVHQFDKGSKYSFKLLEVEKLTPTVDGLIEIHYKNGDIF